MCLDLEQILFISGCRQFLLLVFGESEQIDYHLFPLKSQENYRIYDNLRPIEINYFVFFYLGFLSRTFTIHRTAREWRGCFFKSSLPLPPASQALRHYPGDCWRELTKSESSQ